MIVFFPDSYPDELLYSQLARYYTKSGYLAYTYAAQDLFTKNTAKPDIEFINRLCPDTLKVLTVSNPIEEVILDHTMFPYYGRFISHGRRQTAFHSLISMSGNHRNLLPIPTNRCRSLRYCPLCAAKDRESFGETYWHRIHQLPDIHICPIHHCNLVCSSVAISSIGSPALITAEEATERITKILYSSNEMEYALANYIADVFLSPMNLQNDIPVGKYLHSKLEGTKYLSLRGSKRNMELLYSDFSDFYRSIPDHPIQHQWQLGKLFSNARHNPYEICMVAMFLRISPHELTNMTLPEKTQAERFDDTILDLHRSGMNYQQIAREMNTSYDTVKAIGEGRYGTYHYLSPTPMQGGSKKKDWHTIDVIRLSAVKEAISRLQGTGSERPQRITVGLIERSLGLSKSGLRQCPLCLAEIRKHTESQTEYWSREILWAVRKIDVDGLPMNITQVKKLTNLRQKNLIACLPYLQKLSKTKIDPYIDTILSLFQNTEN